MEPISTVEELTMRIFFLVILVLSVTAMAKSNKNDNVNMKEFSQQLNQDLSQRVKQNPQEYETRSIMRTPASVTPVEVVPVEEKLDEFDEQGSGKNKL